MNLRFAVRNGHTVLTEEYAEPPFRVGRTFAEGDGVHMIMASSAPGVFGGDHFEQVIHVESGARVRMTSQSALQVHPSSDGRTATVRGRYVVEEGGELSCFWDPLIPFSDSRLDQRFDIQLAAGARLAWSDAFMAGREARGERWRFAALAHELRIVRGGHLDYLERFAINDAPSAPWRGADACYFGSAILSRSGALSADVERLQAELSALEDVRAATDVLMPGLILVRTMSTSGPAFHSARQLAERLLNEGR